MIISLIVAMARNRVTGNKGVVPWRLPADIKHFRSLTMGKPVITGRKTFESIGKALPGRLTIVMTRDNSFHAQGCKIATSRDDALQAAGTCDEVMVIGGQEIYKEFLPLASRIYLTLIDAEIDGDTFFPYVDMNEWRESAREEHAPDEHHIYSYAFITLERK